MKCKRTLPLSTGDTGKVLFEHGMSDEQERTTFNRQHGTRVILQQYFMLRRFIGSDKIIVVFINKQHAKR